MPAIASDSSAGLDSMQHDPDYTGQEESAKTLNCLKDDRPVLNKASFGIRSSEHAQVGKHKWLH